MMKHNLIGAFIAASTLLSSSVAFSQDKGRLMKPA